MLGENSLEAVKKIQKAAQINIVIRASELLSLHVSEPPGLRVLAAWCIGGIREAQTISYNFLPFPIEAIWGPLKVYNSLQNTFYKGVRPHRAL